MTVLKLVSPLLGRISQLPQRARRKDTFYKEGHPTICIYEKKL